MLSKIIENVARIIDDIETLEALKTSEDLEDNRNIEIYRQLTNFVITSLAQKYLCYTKTEAVASNGNCEIDCADLTSEPIVIKRVYDQNKHIVHFVKNEDTIFVSRPNKVFYVEYAYVPQDLENLTDTVLLPMGLDYKIVCYGVASEYLAMRMEFTEANIWEEKFKAGLVFLGKHYGDIRFARRRF